MQTNELTGAALDWAVAKCEGLGRDFMFKPSTNWSHGGPIIEREGIAIGKSWEGWKAFTETSGGEGPTPLIAAMRCYVASKLGDEVEIPEELQ